MGNSSAQRPYKAACIGASSSLLRVTLTEGLLMCPLGAPLPSPWGPHSVSRLPSELYALAFTLSFNLRKLLERTELPLPLFFPLAVGSPSFSPWLLRFLKDFV